MMMAVRSSVMLAVLLSVASADYNLVVDEELMHHEGVVGEALIPGVVRSELAEIATLVNRNSTSSWKAEVGDRFSTLEDVSRLCGTWKVGHPNYQPVELEPFDNHPMFSGVEVPESFDARTAWPKCTVISKVRDQSDCGSCWAFGSTEAFEDSRCVHTGEDVEFSTMDTAGCCKGLFCSFSQGCNGGQPSAALRWMTYYGVVTGGDYSDIDTGSGCKPYSLHPCAHHVPATSKYPKCPEKEYSVSCDKSCSETNYTKSYDDDKTKGSQAFSLSSVDAMQQAIMTTGPLAVAFTVYADFPTYKSGVYTHVTGDALGGHAVEMVGWGVDADVPYWWVKNSWNEQWGDEGFFKIKRGTDECGIENDVTGIKF